MWMLSRQVGCGPFRTAECVCPGRGSAAQGNGLEAARQGPASELGDLVRLQ